MADHVQGRSADRGSDVHCLAVVEDHRDAQHPHQLHEADLAAAAGQVQHDSELFSELPEAARQLPVNQWHFRGRTS